MERIGIQYTKWNGYTISENGTIFNKNGSVKLLSLNAKGYLFSNFYYKGRLHCHLAHTVVWWAFNGEKPPNHEVDHKNNDRVDNRLDNLQLLSKSANNKKSYDSGNRNFLFGQTNPNSKTRKKNG